MTITETTPAAQLSAPPARRNPVEVAREQVVAWWERHAARTNGNQELLDLLEWKLAELAEVERLLGEERACTLRAMSQEAGSIRKLSERMGRPFSTLRAQMKLNKTDE
jgi:hypothetical protein